MSPAELRSRIARRRAHARRVLWFERIWPALWPAFALIGLWLAASLFNLPSLLPGWWHIGLNVAVIASMVALLVRGLRPLDRPSDAEVDRRLERATGLRHRPLVVIDDTPANADAAGSALWQAHLERAAAQVARLRVGWPHPGIPQLDVRATRAALGVLLVVGLVVAGAEAPGRLLRSVWPGLPQGTPVPEPELQAWLTPPSYTGQPPVFLHPATQAVTIPAGAHLTVSLTGGTVAPSMEYGGAATAFATLDTASWQADRDISQDGDLVVRRRGRELGHWQVSVIPDAPPTVAWASPPGSPRGTRRLQTRLPWTVTDDYGVASLQAELRLKDRPAADPITVNIPLPSNPPKQAHGAAVQDLTANPWAGLPVIARLVAKDAPGHKAASADAEFVLPERAFKNPLARAVIDIRKRLTLAPDANGDAAADLQALAEAPDAFDNNTGVFLALSSTASLLARSNAPADIAQAQARLWALALQLEDDAVARTAQAVQAARDALKNAVQKGDKTEMDKKADALRREIQKHLQALAEKARKDGTLMPFDPSTRTLNQQDFDKLAQQMQDAARAGRMDEAQEKLQQLEQMLEQLKQAEANPSGDRQQARQQRQRGQQQMGAAEDMVQREGVMKQRATERDGAQDKAADKTGRDTDGKQQKALRRALGEMMQNFADLTGKIPDALGQADIAMDQAGQALGTGNDKAAGQAQQRAIDALQKGQQQMSQQMAQSLGISVQPGEGEGDGNGPGDQMSQDDGQGDDQMGNGRGDRDAQNGEDGQPGDQQADVPRDPLGRPTKDGTSGRADGGDVHVPDQMEQARTRELQAELRKRGGERTRPPGELEYIDRLLKAY